MRRVGVQSEAACGPEFILVNNVGVMFAAAVGSEGYKDKWRTTYAVNVGPTRIVTALLAQLRKICGRHVNICLTSAYLASPGGIMYGAIMRGVSRAAIVQLTG